MSKKPQKKQRKRAGQIETAGSGILPRAVPFLEQHAVVIVVGLVLIASLRIVSTYWVFNHTADEPAHITSGLEYLSKNTYFYDCEHPPLARVMAALGPYLAGERFTVPANMILKWDPQQGMAALYNSKHYDRNLALARLGILPFFWLACAVTFFWTKRYFGRPAAVIAVLLLTLTPPVLAHAGLATTDMALTAFAGAGFLMLLIWTERPTLLRSIALGLVVGLGVLSKFTMMPFLLAAAVMAVALQLVVARPKVEIGAFLRSHALPFAVGAVTCALVVWAGYKFSFGMSFSRFGGYSLFNYRVPVPELFNGLEIVINHNRYGHASFLLGEAHRGGWWYYYLLSLGVKTPLPLLILLGLGIGLVIKRRRDLAWRLPAAFSFGIVLFSLFSRINIGVRHVLPAYVGFSIIAAAAVLWLIELSRTARWPRWALGILLVWFVAGGAWKHPDYIAYFNELAGSEPEKVLVDSDLDWGQDMKRLGRRLRELGAKQVYLVAVPTIFPHLGPDHGFPQILEMDPKIPLPGWTAVGPTAWKALWPSYKDYQGDMKLWIDEAKPRERVGSMLLFYVPPQGSRQ